MSDLERAVKILKAGGLVAFPTETVYGLGADASNRNAVRRIFAAKGRPADHPLIVHLASEAMLPRWARDIPPSARSLAEHFWPGPLTLILKRAGGVIDEVTGGQDVAGAGRTDFAGLAKAAGIERVYAYDTVEAWRHDAAEVLSGTGPAFVWLKVAGERGKATPTAPRPMPEQIRRLREAIGA